MKKKLLVLLLALVAVSVLLCMTAVTVGAAEAADSTAPVVAEVLDADKAHVADATTLQEAMTLVQEGYTVRLKANITADQTLVLAGGVSWTFDGARYNYTYTGDGYALKVEANTVLSIVDLKLLSATGGGLQIEGGDLPLHRKRERPWSRLGQLPLRRQR